jgi:3-hydroxybutyryl-CoA dehydratase
MIGQKVTKFFDILDQDVRSFSKLSTDINPIHLSDEFASKTIFKKRIAHGMYVGSFISAVIANDLPGLGTIYLHQSFDFKKPVYLGDRIAVTVEVISMIKPTVYELETICTNQNDQVVIQGKAVVKVPQYE